MKKIVIITVLLMNFYLLSAQNVAINSTGNPPEASAILDISASDKGVLIPRLADHTTVSSPVDGLTVFDTSTGSFWYYFSSAWHELGSGGSTGGGTLDDAYDFGGAGNGRIITADNGAVRIYDGSNIADIITSTEVLHLTDGSELINLVTTGNSVAEIVAADKERGITVTNSKSLSYGLYAENSNTGVAIYGEVTNTSNQYSAIQGISNYASSTSGVYPSGLSGYFDGSGIGVGVWGESQGNGTAAGAGVYGNGKNRNFGGWFYSASYPGLNVRTGSSSVSAAQITSASASNTNPALLVTGSTQFNCGNESGGHNAVFFNALATDPTFAPQAADYGYIGTSSVYWLVVYTDNIMYKNAGNFKKSISVENDNLSEFVMNDIDKINPIFFQPSRTTSNPDSIGSFSYRPNYTLGVNIDELPDYVLDNSYSMINAASFSALAILGVKYNHQQIQKMQEKISDFGIVDCKSGETWVNFGNDFASKLSKSDIPTVILTTNNPVAKVYISKQNSKGFLIQVESIDNKEIMVNWIAMAKVSVDNADNGIPPDKYSKLVVPQDIKVQIKNQKPKEQKVYPILENQDCKNNKSGRL